MILMQQHRLESVHFPVTVSKQKITRERLSDITHVIVYLIAQHIMPVSAVKNNRFKRPHISLESKREALNLTEIVVELLSRYTDIDWKKKF